MQVHIKILLFGANRKPNKHKHFPIARSSVPPNTLCHNSSHFIKQLLQSKIVLLCICPYFQFTPKQTLGNNWHKIAGCCQSLLDNFSVFLNHIFYLTAIFFLYFKTRQVLRAGVNHKDCFH